MKKSVNLFKNIWKLMLDKPRIFFSISIILAIVIMYFIINVISESNRYKKYVHYEEKMNAYGFNRLYDNGFANSNESVTKSEAIKMVIGTCLNTFEIEDIAKEPTEKYENAIWVLYAQDMNLIDKGDINKKSQDNKVSYIEVIKYFVNAKAKLLKKNLSIDTDKKLSDLKKYTLDEQNAVVDMLANDILKEVGNKLKGNKNIIKGQLNEIVVNYVEKYNLFGENIQNDMSKLPNNALEYAYISSNVEKEVYEIPFKISVSESFVSPKESFSDIKKYYSQIIQKIEKYYNTLINIDYQTTKVESLKNDLRNLTLLDADEISLNEYIEYINDNKIKIAGTTKVQTPIIYYDGYNYRVRTKIDFKVESSKTKDNLLYGDLNSGHTVRYDNNDNTIIVDVIMGEALNTGTYYIKNTVLDDLMRNK